MKQLKANVWIALATVFVSTAANAGNQDSFFLGNAAAMSAGAITATARGGDAAWYNPAGLGDTSPNTIDASASAFVLRIRKIPKLAETLLPGGDSLAVDVSSTELLSVPSALAYTRALSDTVWLGLGIFVAAQDQLNLRDDEERTFNLNAGALRYRQHVALTGEEQAMYAGPSVGVVLSESVRLGASLFVVYGTARSSLEVWSDAQGQDSSLRAFGLFHETFDVSQLGLQAVVGTQIRFSESWSLGATLRSPVVRVAQWGESTQLDQSALVGIPGEAGDLTLAYEPLSLKSNAVRMAIPGRLHLGLAWEQPWGWLSAEVDVAHPLSEDIEAGVAARRWTTNARVGTRVELTPTWAVGGGLFTDLSPYAKPSLGDLGTEWVNYVGATFGVEVRSPHRVVDETGERGLAFSSTFALRYAAGIGEYIGSSSSPFDDSATDTSRRISLLYHEVGIHIGSGLSF